MDLVPFLELDLLDIKEAIVPEVKKFHKAAFDPDNLADVASELRYTSAIKQLLSTQSNAPDDDFVSYVLTQVYDGRKTQVMVDKFRPVVRKSFVQFINETVNEKLKSAMQPVIEQPQQDKPEAVVSEAPVEETSRIQTTADEMQAFFIVKGFLIPHFSPDRIVFKDNETYCTILIDNNVRRWICRMRLEGQKKSVSFPATESNPESTVVIDGLSDLYGLKERFEEAALKHKK